MQCVPTEKPEKDINDVFDELLFCEERSIEQGHRQGFEQGLREGNVEAYHLGYHRGAELGSELGFYSGVIETYLASTGTNNLSEKVSKNLNCLKELIDKFPKSNDENVDIIKGADDIRTLYKKVCALLKIDAAYPEKDNLSF